MAGNGPATRETLSEQAAEWVVRQAGGLDQDAMACLRQWRQQSFAHELAFQRELASWERLDALRAASAVVPAPKPPVNRLLRWAAAACVLIGSAGLAWWSSYPTTAYATAIGERRLVRLDDGSSVELNTDSKIVVRYGHGLRAIRLLYGEAWFDIADDARPFVVDAGKARLKSRGSTMNVRVAGDGTAVTVASGSVEVASATTASPPRLDAGEAGWLDAHGVTEKRIDAQDMQRQLAWQHGAITLDGRSLAKVAEEFNRYSARKILIDDPSIAPLQLAGYFRIEDRTGFVHALETAFPVQASRDNDGNLHLRRR